MKEYEKPIAEIIDFTAEMIMENGEDTEVGDGISDTEQGGGRLPGM